MLAAIEAFVVAAHFMGGAPADMQAMGMMPEVVATAPRYEGEDVAYAGMMPEIYVYAPRISREDIGSICFSRVFHTHYLLFFEESGEALTALAKE